VSPSPFEDWHKNRISLSCLAPAVFSKEAGPAAAAFGLGS
jgi:hypothetical protein